MLGGLCTAFNQFISVQQIVFSSFFQIMCLHYKALSHFYVADGLLKSIGKHIKGCKVFCQFEFGLHWLQSLRMTYLT